MTRLFVGNLAYSLTEDELAAAFAEMGVAVANVKILKDRETSRPRGFGFVEVENGPAVIDAMNGAKVMGRPLRIEEASRRPERAEARNVWNEAEGSRGRR